MPLRTTQQHGTLSPHRGFTTKGGKTCLETGQRTACAFAVPVAVVLHDLAEFVGDVKDDGGGELEQFRERLLLDMLALMVPPLPSVHQN